MTRVPNCPHCGREVPVPGLCHICTPPASDRTTGSCAETIRAMVTMLKDRDCPYLGSFKLGYDAALDELLDLLETADVRP